MRNTRGMAAKRRAKRKAESPRRFWLCAAARLPGQWSPMRRLDQLLANLGYCSRREAREWLDAGLAGVATR